MNTTTEFVVRTAAACTHPDVMEFLRRVEHTFRAYLPHGYFCGRAGSTRSAAPVPSA